MLANWQLSTFERSGSGHYLRLLHTQRQSVSIFLPKSSSSLIKQKCCWMLLDLLDCEQPLSSSAKSLDVCTSTEKCLDV